MDQDSDYPPQAPRTKLSYLNLNVEAILARQPDLVVISNEPPGLAKRLAGFSIPVLDLPAPASLSGVYAEFDQLGRATGNLAGAEREVASLRSQISQIRAAVPRRSAPVTYYYELDQTYFSVTSATFVGKLLGLLGMKSIADSAKGAAAAGGYPQLSAEYIVKANPDFVILADTICCHQDVATLRAGRAGPGSGPSSPGMSSRSTTTSHPAGDRGSSTCSGSCWRPCSAPPPAEVPPRPPGRRAGWPGQPARMTARVNRRA